MSFWNSLLLTPMKKYNPFYNIPLPHGYCNHSINNRKKNKVENEEV